MKSGPRKISFKIKILTGVLAVSAVLLFFLSKQPGVSIEDGTIPASEMVWEIYADYVSCAHEKDKRILPIKKFAVENLCVYKSLPSYSQPKWMDSLVRAGVIPPLKERLPQEPCVVPTGGMVHGPGQYGGVIRMAYNIPIEGWNWGGGQAQGWFGINLLVQQSLVLNELNFTLKDGAYPLPNLARSWEWKNNGYELIMHLVKGARWSDGHPFTTKDVLFTWEDLILDENIPLWGTRSTWQIDGKDTKLEALDDYTLKWTFPEAYPVRLFFQMGEYMFALSPRHVLKHHHPRYNKKSDYMSFENCLLPENLPVVTLGPWVPVYYKTDELLVMRRNPYYWKVDENGRQLPYVDEVTYKKTSNASSIITSLLSGAIDFCNLEDPEYYVEMNKKQYREGARYKVHWGREVLGYGLYVNYSLSMGVNNEKDLERRKLHRNLTFRRALSHAIDREGITQVFIRGSLLSTYPGGLYPGSPYFDSTSAVCYPYSPSTSRKLLEEVGFKDTDKDGIVNWTKGPLSGENLVISMITGTARSANVELGELLIPLFKDVGIKATFRPVIGTLIEHALETGKWDFIPGFTAFVYDAAFMNYRGLAPIIKNAPHFHKEGKKPRVLLPFETELVRITNEFMRQRDFDKRKVLINQYNRIYTDNLYFIGVFAGPFGVALDKRFKNVAQGSYSRRGLHTSRPDQIWVPESDQLKQMMQGTVPVFSPN
jgi:peptide/nickel transport system substrate-binding protein